MAEEEPAIEGSPAVQASPPAAVGGDEEASAMLVSPDVAEIDSGTHGGPGGCTDERELSFFQHLCDRFDMLWQERMEPSQRLLEQVTMVLKNRAQLERQYGSSLIALPDEVKLDPSTSTVHEAVDAVMVNFRNRGDQCMELAEQIENDIVLTFEEVMKQHRETSKRMFTDAQRLMSYCRDTKTAYQKLAKQYFSICTEAENVGQDCLHSLAMRPEERNKVGLRVVQLSKQAKCIHRDYLSSIEQANRAHMLYEQHMPSILIAMQDMEMKRATCLRDSLMKLAVYETSWLRNLQYDIDATVKSAEVSDPAKDVQEFIRSHQTEGGPQVAVQFVPKPFWELGKPRAKENPQIAAAKKFRFEADAVIKQHADGLRSVLTGLLAQTPPERIVERTAKSVEQLKTNMMDLKARAAFFQVFTHLLVMKQPQQEQVDVPARPITIHECQPVKITASCFEVIVELVLEACQCCEQQGDAWCGKLIMSIVQLVLCDGEGGRIVHLVNRVYNHPIWNKKSFWEEVLLVGICEAHACEAVCRRQAVDNSQPPTGLIVITPFITHFASLMSTFGIRGDQAKASIREGLKKHMSILGSSHEQYSMFLIQHVEELEAKALAVSQAEASAVSTSVVPPATFSPPPRQLEASADDLEAAHTSNGACDVGPEQHMSADSVEGDPLPGVETPLDSGADFSGIALGGQDSFEGPEDSAAIAAVPDVVPPVDSPKSPDSTSPGNKEPVDALRNLGVDQPSSSDVFG